MKERLLRVAEAAGLPGLLPVLPGPLRLPHLPLRPPQGPADRRGREARQARAAPRDWQARPVLAQRRRGHAASSSTSPPTSPRRPPSPAPPTSAPPRPLPRRSVIVIDEAHVARAAPAAPPRPGPRRLLGERVRRRDQGHGARRHRQGRGRRPGSTTSTSRRSSPSARPSACRIKGTATGKLVLEAPDGKFTKANGALRHDARRRHSQRRQDQDRRACSSCRRPSSATWSSPPRPRTARSRSPSSPPTGPIWSSIGDGKITLREPWGEAVADSGPALQVHRRVPGEERDDDLAPRGAGLDQGGPDRGDAVPPR